MASPLSDYWRLRKSHDPVMDLCHLQENMGDIASMLTHGAVKRVGWTQESTSYTAFNKSGPAVTLNSRPLLDKNGNLPVSGPLDPEAVDVVTGNMLHEAGHTRWKSDAVTTAVTKEVAAHPLLAHLENILEDAYIDRRTAIENAIAGQYIRKARAFNNQPGAAASHADRLTVTNLDWETRLQSVLQVLASTLLYDQPLPGNLPAEYLAPMVDIITDFTNLSVKAAPKDRAVLVVKAWRSVSAAALTPPEDPQDEDDAALDPGISLPPLGDGMGSPEKPPSGGEPDDKADAGEGDPSGDAADGDAPAEPGDDENDEHPDLDDEDADDSDLDRDPADDDDDLGLSPDMGDDDDAVEEGLDDDEMADTSYGDEPAEDLDSPVTEEKAPLRPDMPVIDVPIEMEAQPLKTADAKKLLDYLKSNAEDLESAMEAAFGAAAGTIGGVLSDARPEQLTAAQEKVADAHTQAVARAFTQLREQDRRHQRGLRQGSISQRRLWRAGAGRDDLFQRKEKNEEHGAAVCMLLDNSSSIGLWTWDNIIVPMTAAVVKGCGREYDVWAAAYTNGDRGATKVRVMHRPEWNGELRQDVGDQNGTPSAQAIVAAGVLLRKNRKQNRLVIHVTDGQPGNCGGMSGQSATLTAIADLARTGVKVLTLLVGTRADWLPAGTWATCGGMDEAPEALRSLLHNAMKST